MNLANVILQLKALNVPNIDEFDFVDPPKAEVIRDSIEMLKDIHALDENVTKPPTFLSYLIVKPHQPRKGDGRASS